MLLVNILFLISLLFINIYKSKRHLHMMQQNLYNENNRYIRWILKNSKFINIELFQIIYEGKSNISDFLRHCGYRKYVVVVETG